jgi:hypothetical protein
MTICNKGTSGSSLLLVPYTVSKIRLVFSSERSRIPSNCLTSPAPHLLLSLHFLSSHPSGVLTSNLSVILTHSVPSRDHHHYSIIPPIQSRTPHLSRRASSSHSVSLSTATCRHRCQHPLRKKGVIEPATHTKLIHATAAAIASVASTPTLLMRGK